MAKPATSWLTTSLFPTLGQTRYLANRELRHAEISREMAERGDYITPHLVGKLYPEKPPAMHAVAAVAMRWWGAPSMFLARLPSALAAIGITLMTYGLGRVLSGRSVGLVGALALLAIPGFVIMGQQARPDMVLCFAITASALGLALGMRACRARSRGSWFAVAGTTAGLGVVTKGPYGLLFPLLFAALWPIRHSEWRRPWIGWIAFVAALLVVAGAWAVPAYLRDGGQYLHSMIFQEDLDVTRGASHWHSLLTPAILLTVPMIVFLPMAVRDLRRHGYSAPLACAAAIFLVVQAIPKKRPRYVLPMYPFLALGLAVTMVRHAADSRRIRRWACVLIAAGAVVVPLYFGVLARWVEHPEDPDLRAARQILAVAEAPGPIYVLVRLDEALAWVARDHRRVVWVDVEDPQALQQVRAAPRGAYLVMTPGQQETLGNSREIPLETITKVTWPRRKLDEILSLSRRPDRELTLLRVL